MIELFASPVLPASGQCPTFIKEVSMQSVKVLLTALALMFMAASPALAVDTSKTYSSGILILLFVGFCALIIIAQLVPAILALLGMTKEAVKSTSGGRVAASVKKH